MSTTAVPMHPERFIDIQSVEQTFRTRQGDFTALRDIHLTVAQGEFVTLIGHSGCGKSTLLNLIAGIDKPDAGRLAIAGEDITRQVLTQIIVEQESKAGGNTMLPIPFLRTESQSSRLRSLVFTSLRAGRGRASRSTAIALDMGFLSIRIRRVGDQGWPASAADAPGRLRRSAGRRRARPPGNRAPGRSRTSA